VASFRHFAGKKSPKATVSRELLEKIPKNSPHLEEEGYEIVKIFEGIGQICSCSFWKLSYSISRFYWFVIM
jgi:hypothetical protein